MYFRGSRCPGFAASPANNWLGTKALAFGREVGEWRFDSVALAEEIGLTVKLTRFRIERKNWFDRASCPPVRQLQRQLGLPEKEQTDCAAVDLGIFRR